MIIPALFYAFLSQNPKPSLVTSIAVRGTFSAALMTSTSSCTCTQLRSTWDILWSCLATVFACTWVSVHPNCPGKGEGQWKVVARRVELMVWSILIPEMVIFWAMRQWLGARHLARYYKSFGWTTTHGHFLQMGGFLLVDGDQDLEVITHDRFRSLLKEGTIRFPSISKEEIEALSKGDALSKTIVVGQTLWFIAQCISRSVEGLVITEIELVTLAFAFLNGIIYFLWWNKPLDASFIVRIPLCSTRNPVRLPLTSSTATFVFPYLSISIEEMSRSHAVHQLSTHPETQDENNRADFMKELPYAEEASIGIAFDAPHRLEDNEYGRTLESSADQLSVDANTSGEILKVPKSELRRPENTYSSENIRSSRVPSVYSAPDAIYHIQNSPSASGVELPSGSGYKWLEDATKLIWRRMADIQGISTLEPGAKRVPTFYATIKINTVRGLLHTFVISCVGIGFGAIHCAGWNFVFRTQRDKIIWQVSSTIITVFPFVAILYVLLVYRFVKRTWGRKISRGITYWAVRGGIFVWYVFVRCLPLYLVARVILLLEALIALRNLPDGAFAQVEWSTLVPHI